MGDLLSAASLLLAVVAVIYGFWYPEITAALKITPALHKEDRAKDYERVRYLLKTRAIPLLFVSGLLTLVFVPDTLRITCSSAQNYRAKVFRGFSDYDAVATSFVFVTCLLGF